MNDGRYTIPAEDYFAIEGRASQSALKQIAKSPAHLRQYLDHPPKPSAAMRLGTAIHTATLEPGSFLTSYVRAPKGNRRTKAYKEALAQLAEAHRGCEILDADDYDTARRIAGLVHAHPVASELFAGGTPEVSVLWTDYTTEVPCKGRPDYVRKDGVIVDLKTTKDAQPEAFARVSANFKYHMQAAFYLDGCDATRLDDEAEFDAFVIVAVEQTPPHGIMIYELDANALEIGRRTYREALAKWDVWQRTPGGWEGYPVQITPLSLPPWVTK